jgi:hypothetical protein
MKPPSIPQAPASTGAPPSNGAPQSNAALPSVVPAVRGTVGVRLHGASLVLHSDHEPLIDYARLHLGRLAVEAPSAPDIEVLCRWTEGEAGSDAPDASAAPRDVIGKRMTANADELEWLDTLRMPGLVLRFERGGERWRFVVDYRYSPKRRNGKPVPDYEYKRYFSLMSWLVYYPLMWFLRHSRGWIPIHASALATPGGGVLIAGLGGVGKTTTCIALLERPGIRLLSENLVLTDGDRVYAVDEPVRLDDESVALLGASLPALEPMEFPDDLKKKRLYRARNIVESTVPVALYLPRFSDRSLVSPLDPALAAERIEAIGRLTRELEDFEAYAAALDLQWPVAGLLARRVETLHQLTRRVGCYTLGIDRGAGIAPVVEAVLDRSRLGETSGPVEQT